PRPRSRPRRGASRSQRVERLVDEPVGELVMRALHVTILDASEPPRKCRRLVVERPQARVLDAVLAAHLLHHQLGIGDQLELPHAELDRLPEAGDEPAVLGDVVGRRADRLPVRREDAAVVRLEHVTVRRRTGVAARAAVGEEPGPHASSSYTSNAGSSYGCAARSAATTSSCRSASKTVSSRSSATRSSTPRSPTAGAVDSPPRNVPVPSAYHEQRS